MVIGWTLFIIYFVYQIYKFLKVRTTKYSAEDLFQEIKKIQNPTSDFSLVIIKNNHMDNSRKILLAYDKRWKCYLLPYYHTIGDIEIEKKKIVDNISQDLQFNKENISIEFKEEVEHTKYSVSNERTKTYKHRFYKVLISNTNNTIVKPNFKINGKKYKWFSITEMKLNKNIMRKNQDVIEILDRINC